MTRDQMYIITQTNIHTHFMALWTLTRAMRASRYQNRKTNLDLLEQETLSGSGIS